MRMLKSAAVSPLHMIIGKIPCLSDPWVGGGEVFQTGACIQLPDSELNAYTHFQTILEPTHLGV